MKYILLLCVLVTITLSISLFSTEIHAQGIEELKDIGNVSFYNTTNYFPPLDDNLILGGSISNSEPKVQFDKNIDIAWIENEDHSWGFDSDSSSNSDFSRVMFTRSMDNGSTFEKPLILYENDYIQWINSKVTPNMTLISFDTTNSNYTEFNHIFTRSMDNGSTFEKPSSLFTTTWPIDFDKPLYDINNDTVFVSWVQNNWTESELNDDENLRSEYFISKESFKNNWTESELNDDENLRSELFVMKSNNSGNTFGDPKKILSSELLFNYDIKASENNVFLLTKSIMDDRIILHVSNNYGKDFKPIVINAGLEDGSDVDRAFLTVADNTVIVTWEQGEVVYTRSSFNSGETFGNVKEITSKYWSSYVSSIKYDTSERIHYVIVGSDIGKSTIYQVIKSYNDGITYTEPKPLAGYELNRLAAVFPFPSTIVDTNLGKYAIYPMTYKKQQALPETWVIISPISDNAVELKGKRIWSSFDYIDFIDAGIRDQFIYLIYQQPEAGVIGMEKIRINQNG